MLYKILDQNLNKELRYKQNTELTILGHVNKNHATVLLTSSNVIHVNFGTTNDHTVSI